MYKLTDNSDCILKVDDGAVIPKGNVQWDSYQQWLKEGNTPDPAFTLGELKARKTEELKRACTAEIEGGFQSSALGEAYTYESSQPHDRENLIGARLANINMKYTCIDSNEVKTEREHTAAQILQVFNDGVLHVQTCRAAFYQKIAALQAATIADEVNSITW